MTVSRRTLIPLFLIVVLLAFGTTSVLAKDNGRDKDTDAAVSVNGTSTGMSQVTNPPASPTDPNGCAPNTGGGKICNFDVSGTFTAAPLGSGTYAGKITLDYSPYTAAHPCATATGTITFTAATGDTITTKLAPGSEVCETIPASSVHTTHFLLSITGGTGRFEDATGVIHSDGTTTDTTTPSTGKSTDSSTLTGSISLEGGDEHGCGNDGHNNGKGNGGRDNGFGRCGPHHDNGHGDDDNGGDD